jgi:hypothetical protein
MAVTLSLFAGAGAQFFDNSGNVLTGGKIFTYLAGTTTNYPTYTSNLGNTAHTNPIVLDSAGRVPGGEIWLQTGIGYKFVVTTSANVLIATYDNIPSSAQPPSANDADSIFYEQGYTVTAGSFIVGKTYRILTIGTTNFTLIGAVSNTVGLHFIATGAGTGTGTAELSQTVEGKLRQYISVKDFGAVGDGVANDTAAIQAAIVAVSTGTNGGGTVYLPRGNYLTTSTIYLPQAVALIGDGRRPGPLGPGGITNIEGSCIIGKHTGAAVVSMKGSAFCGLRHISLVGDQATTPKTGLCLGRTTGGASAGRHHCEDIEVAGWFTAAAIYSIASEETTFVNVHGLVLGGGAKYCFYTSKDDDLSVDSLVSSSNWWANTMVGFNYLHQGNTNDSAAIYIKVSEGTTGWMFRDGFTGMTSGTNSAHVWLHVTEDTDYARDFVFDGVGSESSSNASPPIHQFRVTSSLPCSLRGLRIQNCTPGQTLGGTQHYLFGADSVILDGLFVDQSFPDYPSTVWRLKNSHVNLPNKDLTIRSGALNSSINARQIISTGVGGQVAKTLALAPIYGPVVFTGTGVNAMVVSDATFFTNTAQIDLVVEIDGTPSPNTFKWSPNGGTSFTGNNVPITGADQLLQDGIYVRFSQTTGLTLGDKWECLFDPALLPTQTH